MRFAPSLIGAVLAATLGLAAAAPAAALTVETQISPEFQKKLDKDYGVREGDILRETLAYRIQQTFARRGVAADHVVVTIHDARPNRPTIGQLSRRPGLDAIRSISTGGAHVVGSAYDASGKVIGSLDYDWYETDLANEIAVNTWTDARWTFDRFARRLADQIS